MGVDNSILTYDFSEDQIKAVEKIKSNVKGLTIEEATKVLMAVRIIIRREVIL